MASITSRIRTLSWAAASLLLLISCVKEEKGKSYEHFFTATIRPYDTDKTYIEADGIHDYSCWADGDQVEINGELCVIDVTGDDDAYTAQIGADDVEAVNGGYLAAYPADAVTVSEATALFTVAETVSHRTVSTGAGAGHQVVDAPMVAYTTDRLLQFENVGLLTTFALQKSGDMDVEVGAIEIVTDQPLCGNYTVERNGDSWQYDGSGMNGSARRVLEFATPLALSGTAQQVYIPLMPVSGATTFTVNVYCTIDHVRHLFSRTKSGSISLLRNKVYDFGTLTVDGENIELTDHNSVSYAEIEPAGTASDPYLVANVEEWGYWCNKYAATAGKHFRLEADFTVTTAIPTFSGVLRGDGHTVTLNDCALIAYLNGGTVRNVVTAGEINTYRYLQPDETRFLTGTIAAYAYNAHIIKCHNTTSFYIQEESIKDIGGIAGRIRNTIIDSCINEGSIGTALLYSGQFYAGGIIGSTKKTGSHVRNCVNKVPINTNGSTSTGHCCVGGIAGYQTGSNNYIENSYNTGVITGNSGAYCGGVTGYNENNNTVQNCYYYFYVYGSISYLCYYNRGIIRYCYHAGGDAVHSSESTASEANNARLDSPTQIQGGTAGMLYDQLNTNRTTLGIASETCPWRNNNNGTVLDFE